DAATCRELDERNLEADASQNAIDGGGDTKQGQKRRHDNRPHFRGMRATPWAVARLLSRTRYGAQRISRWVDACLLIRALGASCAAAGGGPRSRWDARAPHGWQGGGQPERRRNRYHKDGYHKRWLGGHQEDDAKEYADVDVQSHSYNRVVGARGQR